MRASQSFQFCLPGTACILSAYHVSLDIVLYHVDPRTHCTRVGSDRSRDSILTAVTCESLCIPLWICLHRPSLTYHQPAMLTDAAGRIRFSKPLNVWHICSHLWKAQCASYDILWQILVELHGDEQWGADTDPADGLRPFTAPSSSPTGTACLLESPPCSSDCTGRRSKHSHLCSLCRDQVCPHATSSDTDLHL